MACERWTVCGDVCFAVMIELSRSLLSFYKSAVADFLPTMKLNFQTARGVKICETLLLSPVCKDTYCVDLCRRNNTWHLGGCTVSNINPYRGNNVNKYS